MTSHILFCLYVVEDTAQRFGNLESRTGQVEDQVHSLEGSFKCVNEIFSSLIYKKKSTDQSFKRVTCKDPEHCLEVNWEMKQ